MQMDVLRCKAPESVRKEIWAHVPAYDLVRMVMAQAAARHDVEPRSVSLKGAVQSMEAFQPVIALRGRQDPTSDDAIFQHLLDTIASHRVGDRPDRFEPRRRNRRPKPYDRLMKPRHEAKRAMLNGVREK
jgi:hypothetical protein